LRKQQLTTTSKSILLNETISAQVDKVMEGMHVRVNLKSGSAGKRGTMEGQRGTMEVSVFEASHWKNRGTMGRQRGTMVR
jgi:hypothetical protein